MVETCLVWASGLVEGVTDDPAVQWSLLGEDIWGNLSIPQG